MGYLNGGFDPAYLFDPRPRQFTANGHITNYFPVGEEHFTWPGSNGEGIATAAARPLLPWKDRFTVLKGVHMSPGFDGHLENFRYLLSGHPFGGELFVSQSSSKASLNFIHEAMLLDGITNQNQGLQLSPGMLRSLAKVSQKQKQNIGSFPGRQLAQSRLQYWSEKSGAFAQGSGSVLTALRGSATIQSRIAKVAIPESLPDTEQRWQMITEAFSHGLTDRCLINLANNLDVHDAASCAAMPGRARQIAEVIANLLEHLDKMECPNAPGKSFLMLRRS